jgi:hypothetical protein
MIRGTDAFFGAGYTGGKSALESEKHVPFVASAERSISLC